MMADSGLLLLQIKCQVKFFWQLSDAITGVWHDQPFTAIICHFVQAHFP